MAAATIWVKVVGPRAQFYQDVLDDNGVLTTEHVRAHTDGEGRQVPVPTEVLRTIDVMRALNETLPMSREPARIVECTPEEVAAHLGVEADKPKKLTKAEQKALDEAEAKRLEEEAGQSGSGS